MNQRVKIICFLLLCVFLCWFAFNVTDFEGTRFEHVFADLRTSSKGQQPRTQIEVVNDEKLKSPNCVKPANADSYIICDQLPFQKPACRNNTNGLVPNIVHYIWIGNGTLKMYHYISMLSVVTNHKPDKVLFHIDGAGPQGDLWLKLIEQIPCLEIRKFEAPTHIYGKKLNDIYMRTDVARFQILHQQGGIYLDSDVIVLKSLDPLRKFPFTMGYNGVKGFSNGAFLAEPNSPFLEELLNGYKDLYKKESRALYFGCIRPRTLSLTRKDLPIHVEETSMHRPNGWVEKESIVISSYDLSDNYMLHIHPRNNKKYKVFFEWGADKIRVHDSSYGAAARASFFGTRDLVFLRGEESLARDRKPRKPIILVAHDTIRKSEENLPEFRDLTIVKNKHS